MITLLYKRFSMDKIKTIISNHIYFIVLALLYLLFHAPIRDFILNNIIPLFSSVADNSLLVQVVMILLTIIPYIVIDYKKDKIACNRIFCLLFVLLAYAEYRFSPSIYFYGVLWLHLSYLDYCWITITIIEIRLFCMVKPSKELGKSDAVAFVKEVPTTKDELDRLDYIPILLDKVISTFNNSKGSRSAFTILINEKYGFGKTSFLEMLKESATEAGVEYINYRPWLSDNSLGLTRSFFNMLGENITQDNRILRKLLDLYSNKIAEPISSSIISYVQDFLKKSEKSLETLREDIITQLEGRKAPFIIAIDDVDRLCFDELITLLKLIRNTADFPNIYYVIAADHSALCNTLETNGIQSPDEYLKKFFNFELLFPANENKMAFLLRNSLAKVLTKHKVPIFDANHAVDELLKVEHLTDLFDNPRDLYRYQNLLSFSLDILHKEKLINDIHFGDLLKVTMIEYLNTEIYKILRDHGDYFITCHPTTGRLSLNENNAFKNKYDNERDKQTKETIERATKLIPNMESTVTLGELINKNKPTPIDIALSLVSDLFHSQRKCTRNCICYSSEYFKYFSGKYRKSEMTNSEAFSLLRLTDEEQFYTQVASVFEQGRGDSLVHKLSLFVESEGDFDRVPISKHLATIFNFTRDEMELNDPWSRSMEPILKFRHYALDDIAFRIYNPLCGSIQEDELTRLNDYFSNDREYLGMALILQAMLPLVEYEARCAISENIIRWRENFIDRFIQEVVHVSPFDKTTLEVISVLRIFPRGYWNAKFKEYLLAYQDPIEWLYRFLKYEEGELKWNSQYYYNLIGDSALSSFTHLYPDIIPEEIDEDISKQHIRIDTPLNHKNISGSIFLSSALDWWQNR